MFWLTSSRALTYREKKNQKEIKRLLLTKKKSWFSLSWKSKETAVKQTAGKAGQIIDQARVEGCRDGRRSRRHQLACGQSKRKDRQSNIHLHKGAALPQPGSRAVPQQEELGQEGTGRLPGGTGTKQVCSQLGRVGLFQDRRTELVRNVNMLYTSWLVELSQQGG